VIRDTIVRAVSAADNEENFDFRSLGVHPGVLFSVYRDLSVSIVLPDGLTGQFIDYFGRTGVTGALCRKIRSLFPARRSGTTIKSTP
jgi:hypothetical protein